LAVFLVSKNSNSIKYKRRMASPASAWMEMKKVATPIETNNKINMAGIATYCLSPNTQKAARLTRPANAK
jgi:hypothetical protein